MELVKGKDFDSTEIAVDVNQAIKVARLACEIVGGVHPAPVLIVASAIIMGIDQFGTEFMKWPQEKLHPWIARWVAVVTKTGVMEGLEMEREGLAGSLRKPKEEFGVVGKEINGV